MVTKGDVYFFLRVSGFVLGAAALFGSVPIILERSQKEFEKGSSIETISGKVIGDNYQPEPFLGKSIYTFTIKTEGGELIDYTIGHVGSNDQASPADSRINPGDCIGVNTRVWHSGERTGSRSTNVQLADIVHHH
jgi:hypothetical protein